MILDIFKNDAFSVIGMTAMVNKQPFVPGQVGASGLFEEAGIASTVATIEEMEGQLSLVAPTPRGGPGETVGNDKRKLRAIPIPHFQRDDSVIADEVQGVREFGSDNAVRTVESVVEAKMLRHTRALDATLEHQRVGALKGLVLDKNGNVALDLAATFGVTLPSVVDFALDTVTTSVRQKCFDIIDAIENELDANVYSGIHAFCGNTFWKKLIDHKSVRETYLNTVQAQELRGNLHTYKFEFGGIVFERYRTGAKAAASTGSPFIAADECRFVPLGVPELFQTRFAPADYMETVNTIGLPRYSMQWEMDNKKGVQMEVQSNPLSYCTRPKVLYSAVAVD